MRSFANNALVDDEISLFTHSFQRAFKFKPNDKQIQEELDQLDDAIERHKVEERMMAQRMILPKEEQRPLPG